jgi:hypothetical protein
MNGSRVSKDARSFSFTNVGPVVWEVSGKMRSNSVVADGGWE